MTGTLVSREGKMEEAMRARERKMLSTLSGNKSSAVQPARWTFRRALGWGLILAFLVPLLVGIAGLSAASASGEADETDSGNSADAGGSVLEGASFYELSASLMNVFSTVQDPSNANESEPWGGTVPANPGSAGALIGYLDVGILENPSRWALSQLSGSSDSMGYDNLQIYTSEGSVRDRSEQGFQNYAYYGAALNGLGFDGTSTGLSMNLGGIVMGAIMYATYHIVYIVDIVFWLFMNILQALNPFRLFYFGMYAISPDLADGMTGGHGSTQFVLFPGTGIEVKTSALSGLVNWIGGWYQTLVAMSWAVIVPIFMGVFLIGLVLFKKMDKGSALKRLLIRMFFIGFGLPLFGSMYSATLDTLSDGLGTGNRGASQVVLSTYVDFETWAKQERLALPEGAVVEWDANRNQPSGNSEACARNTALLINSTVHKLGTMGQTTTCGRSGGNTNANIWSGATEYSEDSNGLLSGYDRSGRNQGTSNSPFSEASDAGVVRDMLGRYMSGSQVTAASFETEVKARMVAAANSSRDVGLAPDPEADEDDTAKTVVGWFEEIPEISNGRDPKLHNNPLIAISGSGERAGLQATETRGVTAFNSDSVRFGVCNNFTVWTGNGQPANCNMAPLAMYNYLNTGFDSTSLTVYSSGNVMSEATREIHNSVNTAGTGVMSFLYWLNSIMLLGAFIVVGLAYAFAMLFGAIKRGFQLISAVPFATLGAIAGIAKVIIYSMALIIEVLMTIFIYLIVQEFLLSLPQIIEAPLVAVLGNLGSGALPAGLDGLTALFSGGVLAMIIPIFSIVATLAFTLMALKLRKTVIKAADEAVTKLVEKFLDTNAVPATAGAGSGLGQGIASGLGAGAGAAAANRLMTGGGAGSKGPRNNVSGTNGADPVTTGAPKGPRGPGGSGMGGALGAVGAGGTTALLGRGGSADGGSAREEDPNDPKNPNGSMGYASDDQSFGEKVRESGLSMDGKGYNHSERNDSNATSDSSSSSSEQSSAQQQARSESMQERGKNRTVASAEQSSTAIRDGISSRDQHSQSQAQTQNSSERDQSKTRDETNASSSDQANARQISAEDTRHRRDSGAMATQETQTQSESAHNTETARNAETERQSQAEAKPNNADASTAVAASNADRRPTNIGGNNSSLSARERAEAQAAAERAERTNTESSSSASESQAQRDHDAAQNTSATREVQAGETQHRESSQATASEQSQDRATESARAEQQRTDSQTEGATASAQEQNASKDVRPVSGPSIENVSNDSKLKQTGGEEKLNQDNRTDQKNFEEQKVDQDNSSEQTVDAKSVAATSDRAPEQESRTSGAAKGVGIAGATGAAAGAGAGITAAKAKTSAAERGVSAPTQKATGARSAATSTKAKTPPVSPLQKTEPTQKPSTRSTQARKTALSSAVKTGTKGAIVGGAKGAAIGIAGGPAGIAAGAARGAAVGGAKGAALGGATGYVKGAVKKPKTAAPSGIKRGVASKQSTARPAGPASKATPNRPGPASASGATPAAPPARVQPPKGRTAKAAGSSAPKAPKPAPARPQPAKSAPTPARPSPIRPAQPPKRPRNGSTPDSDH